MHSVYAAWVEGARECDIAAIRRAMGLAAKAATRQRKLQEREAHASERLH